MNLKFGEKKTTKTENKASTFGVSEEKTINKRFFERSPTNASERCRVAQAPVHDTVVDRYGGPLAVEGVPSLASTFGGGYFPIYHFMTKVLGLGGAKLLVYALIYSFTVSEGSFFGSRGYICEACGIAMSTASKVLFELLNDGFIEKGDTTSFGTVSYIALIEDMPRLSVDSQESEKRNFENRNAEKEIPPIQKSDTPRPKIGHNNKDYTKTNIHTSTQTAPARAHEEGDTEEKNSFRHGNAVPPPSGMEAKNRFAEEGDTEEKNSFHNCELPPFRLSATPSTASRAVPLTQEGGNEVRVIHEGKNKTEEVEQLKREIEAGTFHGEIKVPGDIFLEDELIQRKHGLIDAKRNKDDDLRCTFVTFGYQNIVMLTDIQYSYLSRTYGEDVTEDYIRRLENCILSKPGFKSYSHYKTIIKWLKEDMSCADAFAPA